jgi:cytosine deaminase
MMPLSNDLLLGPALREARHGFAEGGVPVGSALWDGEMLLASGRNRRVQLGDPILHGEMDCFRTAGRLPAKVYRRTTLVTTLSPCDMCTGAILLFGIPRVVIGENHNFLGGEALLRERGVQVSVMDNAECTSLMADFIRVNPDVWNEDIAV